MFEKLRTIFSIPELRKKILLTLALLAIYRIGWHITLPMINQAELAAMEGQTTGGFGKMVEYAAVFSASDLRQATIFGLGIMPYISASIIFQLLGSVWKPIEELQKEGETGRKKINEYTRYADRAAVPGPELVLRQAVHHGTPLAQPGRAGQSRLCQRGDQQPALQLADLRRADHDLRHHLPDVAGRADRRIRHRQRHQPADHGRHPGPHARRGRDPLEQLGTPVDRLRQWARSAWKPWSCSPACSWRWSSAWSSSPWDSGGFPPRAPSTSRDAASTADSASTCRCASTRPA